MNKKMVFVITLIMVAVVVAKILIAAFNTEFWAASFIGLLAGILVAIQSIYLMPQTVANLKTH